jgi:hypothetical protein
MNKTKSKINAVKKKDDFIDIIYEYYLWQQPFYREKKTTSMTTHFVLSFYEIKIFHLTIRKWNKEKFLIKAHKLWT